MMSQANQVTRFVYPVKLYLDHVAVRAGVVDAMTTTRQWNATVSKLCQAADVRGEWGLLRWEYSMV